jgi:glycosyltransferase involved in cell wall biosynthesis
VPRLSVVVPAEQFRPDGGTGAGRVWASVLPHLRQHARVRPSGRLRLRRPDVWLLPALGHPVARREPVVPVIHGSAWMLDAAVLDLMPRTFAEPFVANTEATLARASAAIVPSEYTRRGLTEGLGMPEDRIDVVPHGVDARVFHPSARGGRRLVSAALGHDRPYVLFASIPSIRQKNLSSLKQALAGLAEQGLPHALAIAGGTAGGEPEELLKEIAADPSGFPGRVAWLGHVDDTSLAGLMAEADAFCLPSLYEAFGLTALEAMACGAPVVASTRGALPEVVNGAGLLCEPAPHEIEAALRRVLSDAALARRLGEAGRERAERFTWERTAEGWLAALRRAAEES